MTLQNDAGGPSLLVSVIGIIDPKTGQRSQPGLYKIALDGRTITDQARGSFGELGSLGNTSYVMTITGLAASTDGGKTLSVVSNNPTVISRMHLELGNSVYRDGNTVILAGQRGLYISTDAGITFRASMLAEIVNTAVASGPKILAATSRGLFLSEDYGQTFVAKSIGIDGLAAMQFKSASFSQDYIWGASGAGFSISKDGGRTFETKTTANGLSSNSVYRFLVHGTPTNPTAYYFVSTDDGLFLSTNGGTSFQRLTLPTAILGFVRGIYMLPNNQLYVTTARGFAYSTDLGATWKVPRVVQKSGVALSPSFSKGAAMLDGNIYVGVDGGVAVSRDSGATFFLASSGLEGIGQAGQRVEDLYVSQNTLYVLTPSGLRVMVTPPTGP
jgi:photosystem II stability/assembly factor-like uncharacterized protein